MSQATHPSAPAAATCQRWVWIELIGFDNTVPDYGVGEVLQRAGFVPDAVSLLLFTPDVVHSHQPLDTERVLPPDHCSYSARPRSLEHDRQDWTNHQLRGLVGELRRHGVAVYASFFNLFSSYLDGQVYRSPWCDSHPELWEMSRTGQPHTCLCPLKRLADGTYYEDLFGDQLATFLQDYGFAGLQGADGYSCTRRPLFDVDFSDDLVEQFQRATGLALPDDRSGPCDGDAAAISARADYLLAHRRGEWLRFHARRWAEFWRKIADQLHGIGCRVVLNSAWTRDPFEALYRFGIDYRALGETGIDGYVVETVSAGVSVGAEGIEATPIYDYQAMLLLIKAHVPELPLQCLNGVHDTNEQWDVIHHAPTVGEREVYSLSSLFVDTGAEHLTRCSAGPVVCLGDSLRPDEWDWLKQKWALGFGDTAVAVCGATLLWSDAFVQQQLDDYLATQRPSVHKLLWELQSRGAAVRAAVRTEALANHQGPLLVLNPHLLDGGELAQVREYAGGPVVFIGPELPAGLAAACSRGGFHAAVLHGTWPELPETADDDACTTAGMPDPPTFLHELAYQPVPVAFLQTCAEAVNQLGGAPRAVSEQATTRVWAIRLSDGRRRVYVANDRDIYRSPVVDLGTPIERIEVVTAFPCMPIWPNGTQFQVKVPGKGMVVLDVVLADG